MDHSDAKADDSKQWGKREQNKLNKERAICAAAKDMFLEKGYEATTLREIAKKANVGFGTIFAYSQDKSGLLAMIFIEQLRSLPPLFHDMKEEEGLEDMLVRAFGHLYNFWASVPTLSNHVLQQMEFFKANPYVGMIIDRRVKAKAELTEWVKAMQGKKAIARDLDPDAVSATLFAIYTSSVREWSGATPENAEIGLKHLRKLLAIAICGLVR